MTRLLHFEQQLTVVLAAMEHDGIAIDRQGVEDFGVYLSEQIEEMQQMVYDEAGHTFNIGSPKQLEKCCSGKCSCPTAKRPRPAIPPMRTFWKNCGESMPLWTMC